MIPLERSICLGSLGNACRHVCMCIKMGPVLTLLSRVQFPSTEKETGTMYQKNCLVFNILLLPLIYTLYSCPLSHLYFGQRFCVSSVSHYVNLPSQYCEHLYPILLQKIYFCFFFIHKYKISKFRSQSSILPPNVVYVPCSLFASTD